MMIQRKKYLLTVVLFLTLNTNICFSCNNSINEEKEWWKNQMIKNLKEKDVGLVKKVLINEIEQEVRLIGVNQDYEATIEGDPDLNKPVTTWQFTHFISDSNGYSLSALWNNTSDTQQANHDYLSSTIRLSLNGSNNVSTRQFGWYTKGDTIMQNKYKNKSILEMLPASLQNCIKVVSKRVGVFGNGSWKQSFTNNFKDKLFLLAHDEISNTEFDVIGGEGTPYQWYIKNHSQCDLITHQYKENEHFTDLTQINNADVLCSNSAYNYAGFNDSETLSEGFKNGGYGWLRSPYIDSDTDACCIYSAGNLSEGITYNNAYAVAPVFCL